jgi:hypothetical protein
MINNSHNNKIKINPPYNKHYLVTIAALAAFLSGCGGGAGTDGAGQGTVVANEISATSYGSAPAPEIQSKYVADAQAAGTINEQSMGSLSATTAYTVRALGHVVAMASVAAVPVAGSASEVPIYVASTGNDAWSGSLSTPNTAGTDGPLKTLAAAQAVARAKLVAMAAGATRMKVHVLIGSGTYALNTTLVFTPADSGAAGYPVVYEAQVPGSVNISGGEDLGSITPTNASTAVAYRAPVALAATEASNGGQFYVNGRRAVLARQPNANSYWFVQSPVAVSTESGATRGMEAFTPDAAAANWIAGLDAASQSRAVVNVMQSWTASQHRLSTLPAPAGAVRVTPRSYWPFLQFGTDQRYFVENVAAAFDAQGEWLWDATGVRYIPLAAEVAKPLQGVLPVLDKLVAVQGDVSTANWVQNLELRGINFAYTRYAVPTTGFIDNQAAAQIGAAIEVDGARQLVIDGCQITHTGGYGIWLRNSVRNAVVSNNVLTDLGAGAIKIGMTSQSPTDVNATGANTVTSNRIQYTGLTFPGAVGLWIGQSYNNIVSYNTISDTSYTGISVGWKWGYGGATSGGNSIINNLLVNIGSGWLSDLGAIYTLGESPGTVISGNVIREVHAYPGYGAGAWGIYNDEGTSGALVQNNVVVATDSGGYHLHYGHSNTVTANLFALGSTAEFRVSKTDPLNTLLTASSNLLIPKNASPFMLYATAPDVIYSANLVSSSAAGGTIDISKCGAGCTSSAVKLSVASNPRTVTLTGASTAQATQYKNIGLAAGAQSGPASTVVPTPTTVPAIPATLAPPLQVAIDIANSPVGTQPMGLSYIAATPATAMTTVANATAPAGVCLQFNDTATQRYAWEPYAYAVLNHSKGTTTGQFSILVDATTDFIHEWRDSAVPYLTGPSLRITGAGVFVAGKQVFTVQPNTWLTVKITSTLGVIPAKWNLGLSDSAGRTLALTALPVVSPAWNSLQWAGYISNAVTVSQPCIGSVGFSNK